MIEKLFGLGFFLKTASSLLECKSIKAQRLDGFPVNIQTLKNTDFI